MHLLSSTNTCVCVGRTPVIEELKPQPLLFLSRPKLQLAVDRKLVLHNHRQFALLTLLLNIIDSPEHYESGAAQSTAASVHEKR